MLKWIGLFLVIMAGSGIGIYASIELRQRVGVLERTYRLVGYLATQIRYTAAPVRDLLLKAEKETDFSSLSYLQWICEAIRQGKHPSEAAQQTLTTSADGGRELTAADRDLLLSFFAGLGRSDIDGQLSHCAVYADRLKHLLEDARSESKIKGKMYITLGAAGGIAVALLLL